MRFKILFILFFIQMNLNAQRINGYVFERDEQLAKIPVFGSTVYLLNTNLAAVTDTTGYFSLPADTAHLLLVVSFVGYKSDTIRVSLGAKPLQIELTKLKALQEIEISANRQTSYMETGNPYGTTIITEGELKKAACCNLSESFETNPSIDVNYADAVSGIKQIQFLGLSGIYAPVTVELIPLTRGLAAHSGLTFIPGAWVQSIQVSKGPGPVSNGYESVSGQINTELKKPDKADPLYLNCYQNEMGRSEVNAIFNKVISPKWSGGLFLHGSGAYLKNDANKDGFLDLPLGKQLNFLNRWKFENKGFIVQFGVRALTDDKQGGTLSYKKTDVIDSSQYNYITVINRKEAFLKGGYVFPGITYKSIGFIGNAFEHHQTSLFSRVEYQGKQTSYSGQFIYQSIIGNTRHNFKTGINYLLDIYKETFHSIPYNRTESVSGVFLEYTYNSTKKLDVVGGLRLDNNSLFGPIFTPRLHLKYNFTDKTTLRASIGRGQRTANIFAENSFFFVSSRQIAIVPSSGKSPAAYGLQPEVAWNSGLNLVHHFKLNYKEGSVVLDFYRSDFINQVVVDLDKNPQQILFYNLKGRSFSNSAQIELSYEPARRLNLKLAYRWFDVRTTYHDTLLSKPFVVKNRFFASVSYKTRNKWQFDYSLVYNGTRRLPSTLLNPEAYRQLPNSPAYIVMNAQISKLILHKQNLELYLGCENLTGFRQTNLIIAANEPASKYFDSSFIWGPVIGRMIYLGMRYNLPVKKMPDYQIQQGMQ